MDSFSRWKIKLVDMRGSLWRDPDKYDLIALTHFYNWIKNESRGCPIFRVFSSSPGLKKTRPLVFDSNPMQTVRWEI